MESNTNMKKNPGVPLQGLNAMPFRTEARKCNHWATGRLLELGSKFNGTYMHIKCSFYWQPQLALENVLRKIWKTILKLSHTFQSKMRLSIKSTFHLHIGTVEFTTQFKETPVAQWLRFRASVRKGMTLSSRRRTPFFSFLCWTPIILSSYNLFYPFSTKLRVKRPFKKGYQIWLTVKYINLATSFFGRACRSDP